MKNIYLEEFEDIENGISVIDNASFYTLSCNNGTCSFNIFKDYRNIKDINKALKIFNIHVMVDHLIEQSKGGWFHLTPSEKISNLNEIRVYTDDVNKRPIPSKYSFRNDQLQLVIYQEESYRFRILISNNKGAYDILEIRFSEKGGENSMPLIKLNKLIEEYGFLVTIISE